MKLKSLALVLAIALLVGPAIPAFAANPFADVPADHWAYDAVVQLAAVGLVEGYPDGTYGGTRMMTRYEAALVFARTLARLEALVEDEVHATNAGLRADVNSDLEAAKAEIAALVQAELDALEIPVAEAVERVIVEQPIEKVVEVQPIERPFVMTPEAEEVIAALVAELAQEEIAAAQLGAAEVVTETTIVERIVEAEDALTEDDVVRIAEELLADALAGNREYSDAQTNALLRRMRGIEDRQAEHNEDILVRLDNIEAGLTSETEDIINSIYAMNDEFESELGLLGVRVGSLERLFIALEDRVTAVEARVAQVEDGQDDLQAQIDRVQLGGKLVFEGTTSNAAVSDYFGNEVMKHHDPLTLKQTADLTLSVQASDTVTVNAFLNGELGNFGTEDGSAVNFDEYGVEVLSETPVTRLVVGTLADGQIRDRFNPYVLEDDARPETGALADFELFEGFEGNLVLGGFEDDNVLAGLGMSYSFIDELGLKASVTAARNNTELKAASAGVFGELFDFEYEGTFALDLTAENEADAMLFGADVSGDVGPLGLSAEFVLAGKEFGESAASISNRPFIVDANSKVELGADAEFLGINLDGGYYREMDEDFGALINAFRFGADADFDLVVPLNVSGQFAFNETGDDEETHSELKVGINDLALFDTGLAVGTSVAMVNNYLDDDWKSVGDYTGKDAFVVTGDLGYATDFNGAALDLGYGAQFVIPRVDEEEEALPNELTHTVTAGYGFTDNLNLELSANLFHKLAEEADFAQEYSAGLTFSF